MNVTQLIENGLKEAVASASRTAGRKAEASGACPKLLAEAIGYAVFSGGARVRPKLCLAVAGASSEPPECERAAGAAVAIELLHCASLVHDDLPCFDDADTRRGAPSVHCAFSEPIAVLTGDALIVMAFEALARAYADAPATGLKLVGVIGAAAGAPAGIVAGQAWESEPEIDVRAYHRSKTGALFVAACEAGATAVDADPSPWRRLGLRLGEAYQVADDIRDAIWPEELMGKPAGVDERCSRPSSVKFFGLQGAVEHLGALIEDAVDAVPESPGAEGLRALVVAQADRLMACVEKREPSERRA